MPNSPRRSRSLMHVQIVLFASALVIAGCGEDDPAPTTDAGMNPTDGGTSTTDQGTLSAAQLCVQSGGRQLYLAREISCGVIQSETLSAPQLSCKCPAGENFVDGVGCEPDATCPARNCSTTSNAYICSLLGTDLSAMSRQGYRITFMDSNFYWPTASDDPAQDVIRLSAEDATTCSLRMEYFPGTAVVEENLPVTPNPVTLCDDGVFTVTAGDAECVGELLPGNFGVGGLEGNTRLEFSCTDPSDNVGVYTFGRY